MEIPKKRKRKTSETQIKKSNNDWTVSIVVPDSILFNSQSPELQTYLVSQVARAASIFNVDEIIILNDAHTAKTSNSKLDAANFFIRNLEYMETPQYLRKSLFPMHPDLRFSGLMNPLDTPHHLRITEDFPYREGVVVDRPVKNSQGSWVNIGLRSDCLVDYKLRPGTRVTIKLNKDDPRKLAGTVVSPTEPKIELGTYWGYQVRLCTDLDSIITGCPFDGGYDLKIGTSDKGDFVKDVSIPKFKHCLIMFGGLAGLEDIYEADESIDGTDPKAHFDLYLNTCPSQGTRTIRSEEAVLISLTVLSPLFRNINA